MPTAHDFTRRYTIEELESMTPILQGHMSNLLLENESEWRLWHSRMRVEDGAKAEHEVFVEMYNPEKGRWEEYSKYFAKSIEGINVSKDTSKEE